MSNIPSAADASAFAASDDLDALMATAAKLRDEGHGRLVSYSRKVFIPLTQLCRDSCHYCTFAHPPRPGERAYLAPDEVLAIARAGKDAGCREALFTLGDKPELRYRAARDELARLGYDTTIAYLAAMAALVLRETGLLPHLNPGVMSAADLVRLRAVSVSQGLMLESTSERLMQRGGPHFGSPDKAPAARLADHCGRGRSRYPLHLRHPDRHRRNAAASASRLCSPCARCTSVTGICKKSSFRIFAPSRARRWRMPPSPILPIISGRSPSHAFCSART